MLIGPEWAYDEDGHLYTHRGRPEFSVTQALSEGGLTDDRIASFWTPAGRQRGTDVHDALAFYFAYGEQPHLEASVAPYWPPLMAFLRESGFTVVSSEQFVTDSTLFYAGRYDFLGNVKGLSVWAKDLVDVKLGSVPRTVGPQTMAYRRCLPPGAYRRWALVVTPENYRLVPLNMDANGTIDLSQDRYDESLFLAALLIAQFRRRHA